MKHDDNKKRVAKLMACVSRLSSVLLLFMNHVEISI